MLKHTAPRSKILHIITGLGTGGAEMMLRRLITMQDPEAVHEVISLRGLGTVAPQLQKDGITVTSIDMFGIASPLAFVRLVRAIRRARPDLVQTWLYHADILGGLAARLAGIRAIVWGVRTADIRKGISLSRSAAAMLGLGAKLSRKLPRRVIYVAEAARLTHEAAGYDPAKSVVIHNGFIVPEEADLQRDGPAFRREIGVPAEALLIGTAGTFTAQKNQIGFVNACAALLARKPDLHLVLIGRGNDPQNHALVLAVAATGQADRIHLIGERRDMSACLSALDLFCLASSGEGFPNVVGEAMVAGTLPLVTDVGDAALLVGDTGTVVPPNDATALADALAAICDLPRETLAERGRRARQRIMDQFTMPRTKERYSALYREILMQKDRR